MDFKDIATTVVKVAPTLANVLLGPLAGSAVSLLTSVFGGDPTNPQDILKKITTDPESAIKLAQIEQQNKIQLQQLYIQQLTLEQQDKASARQREEAMAASGHRDFVLPIVALLFAVGYMAIQVMITFNKLPINDIISARLQDALMLILSYYFGSSYSADKKK